MQNWKKLILIIVVLLPSLFFVSRAFGGNDAQVEDGKLTISGAGGVEVALSEIDAAEMVEQLPELSGTEGFSLGLIKKGDFIRTADQKKVRVVKNRDEGFIHVTTAKDEMYFNLGSERETREVFELIGG